MATLLAPYNTAMQLGSGFNSFTQQLCIDHAVGREPDAPADSVCEHVEKQIAQEVTYKTSVIDKVTDVTSAMHINPAFSIKYDTLNVSGNGDFVNTSKVKESDISFMISVKVVNQIIYDHSLTKFQPISGLKAQNFADVYGDCFISGWQEGGSFVAVISVKAKDQEQADLIKAEAAIEFTKEFQNQKKLDLSVKGTFDKSGQDFLKQNETTISVTWTGGGQHLKNSTEDWTFETMKAAALKFPDLVSQTPIRTHAILTKYTALRSFHASNLQATIPYFEKASVYTALLQEAFLDYKNIAKNLQVLAFDASAGTQTLKDAPAAAKAIEAKNAAGEESDSSGSDNEGMVKVSASGAETIGSASAPPKITKPYPPTIEGLEAARQTVRIMLNRIVQEVDLVARNPDLATDEKRRIPYMSPFLFKEFIPVGVSVASAENTQATAGDGAPDGSAMSKGLTDRLTGTMRF